LTIHPSSTLGHRFTPTNDIRVTHVRHYWGTKVSIWTDGGTPLASKTVTSTPGTWVETALDTPVSLSSGTTYRVAAYSGLSGIYYARDGTFPFDFPHGTIDNACIGAYEDPPLLENWAEVYLVDMRYEVEATAPVSISPTHSGPVVDGTWTSDMMVQELATNMFLRATDGERNRSGSSCFDVTDHAPHGTPLWWLRLHGLTNERFEIEEIQDVDGDGSLAWEEFGADTIPTNAGSCLYIRELVPTNGGVCVRWQGGTSSWQFIEFRTNLLDSLDSWQRLLTNEPPTPVTNSCTSTGGADRAYYRLTAERDTVPP